VHKQEFPTRRYLKVKNAGKMKEGTASECRSGSGGKIGIEGKNKNRLLGQIGHGVLKQFNGPG
jgi:hypothetical protein